MFSFKRNDLIDGMTILYPDKEDFAWETYRVRDKSGKAALAKFFFLDSLPKEILAPDGTPWEILLRQRLPPSDQYPQVTASGRFTRDERQVAYYTVPYTPCVTLDKHLDSVCGAGLSPDALTTLMADIARALKPFHEAGMVHGNLTPDAVEILTQGDTRKVRLGQLQFVHQESIPVEDPWRFQQIPYVATERFSGQHTLSGDIYSLGAILFRLVTGQPPWSETSAALTLQQSVADQLLRRRTPPPLPITSVARLPAALLSISLRALSNAASRFSNLDEMITALEEARAEGCDKVEGGDFALSDFVAPKSGGGFAEVAGMEELKTLLRERIIDLLRNPERAARYKLHIPSGMLLFGPPGCGKSFIAEKFAEEAAYNHIKIKGSDLASIYVHGSTEKIGKLFAMARQKAPAIINFDEFEALVPCRDGIGNASMAGEVNEFLTQMNNCGHDRIFIIASSNRPDLIDPAVRRRGRLDHIIYVPLPDRAAREGIFRVHLQGRPLMDDIDYAALADKSEGLGGSDIAYVVNESALAAARANRPVSFDDLVRALGHTLPSVSADDLRRYEQMRDKMLLDPRGASSRPRVGFC